jgi:sensory rhodopsin
VIDPVFAAYSAAAAAFVVGVLISIRVYISVDSTKHRTWLAALSIIPGFAGLSYVLMALGIGTVTINGTELVGFRYVDWVVTTPLLIGFVGYVAGASRRAIGGVMLADALMILFGVGAVVTTGTGKWILFGASSLFHISLFAYLYVVFPRSVPDDPSQRGLFSLLKNHIGLLWLAYPFVWLMGPEGIGFAGVVGISLTYAFLDVLAKVPYVYFFYARRQVFGTEIATDMTDEDPATGGPTPSDD